jgi:cytochrome c553
MQGTTGGRWAACLLTAHFSGLGIAQEACVRCHGPDGNSPAPEIPSIAGQPKLFIANQLILFREGVRASEQMQPIARGLKDAEISKLAEHFSSVPAKQMESGTADPALIKRGLERAKALRCGQCHLPDFRGQSQIPRLASQREVYLAAEMRAYRDNQRPAGDTVMTATLYGVSDEDIRALAHFLARSSVRAPAR